MLPSASGQKPTFGELSFPSTAAKPPSPAAILWAISCLGFLRCNNSIELRLITPRPGHGQHYSRNSVPRAMQKIGKAAHKLAIYSKGLCKTNEVAVKP